MLLVYGSIDSLFPKICAVDAVGIGATSKLFRTPCLREKNYFIYLASSKKKICMKYQTFTYNKAQKLSLTQIN